MGNVDDLWVGRDRVPTKRHGRGKRWRARWVDDRAQTRTRLFDRKADAERFVAAQVADLARGTYVDPDAGKITLRSYAEDWLRVQTFEDSTRESVTLRLRLHVLPQLGEYELRVLAQRPSLVQAWARGLQQTMAASYVRVVFANLSGIFRAAVDDGLIAKNPC